MTPMLCNQLVISVALVFVSSAFSMGTELQPRAGEPLRGLTNEQLALFEAGRLLFQHPITEQEGLGPIFNKPGCMSCHANPLGGWGTISVSHFGNDIKGEFVLYPGEVQSLAQAFGISEGCKENIPADATVNAIRVTNSSMAFGLIEAIPDLQIAANQDPNDSNSDGISGRVHWVEALEAPGITRAGRFGWKAQVATTLTFSGDASRNEMGLTNRLVPNENPPNGNYALLAQCDTVSDPEDIEDANGFAFIDRVTHFQRYLSQPPQTPKSGMTGELLFNQIGCNKCHVAQWATSSDSSLETAIAGKTIRPYSDFLLHDMGLLADGIQQGDASEGEFRTPVLWNLRTRDPMLHNGSASGSDMNLRLRTAISKHGPYGEGAASSASFSALSPASQQQVIDFLGSLGRIEFDLDGDSHVNFNDLPALRDCFALGLSSPDENCSVADFDQDGNVDTLDIVIFETAYESANGDCNDNGLSDVFEIVLGLDTDNNFNGIPDSCEICTGDLNGDGTKDGIDLGILMASWGQSGIGDIDGNGAVDAVDLALLLAAWGPCN